MAERLLRDGGHVTVIELDRAALGWLDEHPRAVPVTGDGGRSGLARDPEARDS